MASQEQVVTWSVATLAAVGCLWWYNRRGAGGAAAPAPTATRFPVDGTTWPTKPSRRFGYARSATHRHQGVDLFRPKGTLVRAVMSGEIVKVCNSPSVCAGFSGYGKVIVLRTAPTSVSPELYWLYSHLDEVRVSRGDIVPVGQVIGTVGDTCYTRAEPSRRCNPSGPHLHFECSPRPYPQDSEAWRYSPEAMFGLITYRDGRPVPTTR